MAASTHHQQWLHTISNIALVAIPHSLLLQDLLLLLREIVKIGQTWIKLRASYACWSTKRGTLIWRPLVDKFNIRSKSLLRRLGLPFGLLYWGWGFYHFWLVHHALIRVLHLRRMTVRKPNSMVNTDWNTNLLRVRILMVILQLFFFVNYHLNALA